MTSDIANALAAELGKLRSLPGALVTMLGSVAAAIALAATVAASSTGAATDAVDATLRMVPFLQIGPILLGVLSVSTEYTGGQIRTTLAAVPNRTLLLVGKTGAYLVAAAITSAAALSAGLGTAWITLTVRHSTPTADPNAWPVLGAAAYLVLIGLLGHAVTVLTRDLVPALVTMLGLVLIASPLLSGLTEHARYLPDRAGSLLYHPDADAVLTPGTGTLVLLAWITATGTAAVISFFSRDA